MFWTEFIALASTNVLATRDWWVRHFDCKPVPIPSDWDAPLPSDVALQLPGQERATIQLCSQAEVNAAGYTLPGNPILFTRQAKRAREHLIARGLRPTAIQESGGTPVFEVSDGLGNTIEICEEP